MADERDTDATPARDVARQVEARAKSSSHRQQLNRPQKKRPEERETDGDRPLVIAAGSPVYFRWSTAELNVTDAKWEATDSPSGFSPWQDHLQRELQADDG